MSLDCSSIGFSESSGMFMNRRSLGSDVSDSSLDALANGKQDQDSGMKVSMNQHDDGSSSLSTQAIDTKGEKGDDSTALNVYV